MLSNDEKVNNGQVVEYMQTIDRKRVIAKVIYKNVLISACLGATSNMSHVENKCPEPRFFLVDNKFVARAVEADFKDVKND